MANALPPLLGILRGDVNESASNTLTEATLQTPVSASARMIMRIWRIVINIGVGVLGGFPAADTADAISITTALSTRQGELVMPGMPVGGTLALSQYLNITGSAPGDAGVVISETRTHEVWEFPGGIGLADSTLSMYILGVLMGGPASAQYHLYYTMEIVSTDDFLAIASVLSDIR